MMKNAIYELCRKNGWGDPVFDSVNEGKSHLPKFRSYVTINDNKYASPSTFTHKRSAEADASKEALLLLANNGHVLHVSDSPMTAKLLLSEAAVKKQLSMPKYTSKSAGVPHSLSHTATVEFGGLTYTGAPGSTKKEAEGKAAFVALKTVDIDTLTTLRDFDMLTVLAGIPLGNHSPNLLSNKSQLVRENEVFPQPSNLMVACANGKENSQGCHNNGSKAMIQSSTSLIQDKMAGNRKAGKINSENSKPRSRTHEDNGQTLNTHGKKRMKQSAKN